MGIAHFEHLDEGDREVKVGHVTANERKREHDTDRDNGAQVHLASHGNLLARVEYGGEASKTLGHQSRESKMPCGKDNGCKKFVSDPLIAGGFSDRGARTVFELHSVENVLVEQNDGRRQ
jgi:hypothetical protein